MAKGLFSKCKKVIDVSYILFVDEGINKLELITLLKFCLLSVIGNRSKKASKHARKIIGWIANEANLLDGETGYKSVVSLLCLKYSV